MPDRPLLSICIPTYNRAALLSQVLRAIVEQLDGEAICSQVEIIVSDNASSGSTRELVTGLQIGKPQLQLTYYCQHRNLGPDANIYNAVKLARGTFVLIHSDDDISRVGAVGRIVSELRSRPELDALILNFIPFRQQPGDLGRFTSIPQTIDEVILDRNVVLHRVGVMITFLSCMVFRKSLIESKSYSDRVGTSILQSYMFVDVLAHDGPVLLTKEPLIAVRSGNSGGYDFFRVFVTEFCRLMNYAQDCGFSPRAIDNVIHVKLRTHLFRSIVESKLPGWSDHQRMDYLSAAKRCLAVYWSRPTSFASLLLAMIAPRRLTVLLVRAYRRKRRQKTRLGRGGTTW